MSLHNPPVRLDELPTEARNPNSLDIDTLSTLDVLRRINAEDCQVPALVGQALSTLAEVVERAAQAVRGGGPVHYVGAGSSGRLGVMDAAEIPPTYGADPGLIVSHLAGGAAAMTQAVEDAEDSIEAGTETARTVAPGDVVIGLAASGRTPYVIGALSESRHRGAFTVLVSANPGAPAAHCADRHICVDTGAEVVTGSTRMKAATAQKLLLHSFSTALMIRLGRTYSNLMVEVAATNAKLRARVVRLLCQATGVDESAAVRALDDANGSTKLALLTLLTGKPAAEVVGDLAAADGSVRRALETTRAARSTSGRQSAVDLHLGIDIGASGFRLAVADDNGPLRSISMRSEVRRRLGQNGIAATAVKAEVGRHLDDLLAQVPGGRIESVGVGMAGGSVFADSVQGLPLELAQLTGARTVVCCSDAVAAFIGALGIDAGAVLAAGTGAVAIGTDGRTRWRQADGHGFLLGDGGGGAWIGRRGLELALRHDAGRSNGSASLAAAVHRLHGSLVDVVRHVHTTPEPSAVLASFAPLVFAAAADGDGPALTVVQDAAALLAETLIDASAGITERVAIVGGLAQGSSLLRESLIARLNDAGLEPVEAAGTPAIGAAELARLASHHALPAVFQERIIARTPRPTRGPDCSA
jgi:N-acetylmuramic acid 6-phosphate etherase